MRMVFGLVLIVGIALAGFAVYMAQGYISQTQAELEKRTRDARQDSGRWSRCSSSPSPSPMAMSLTEADVQPDPLAQSRPARRCLRRQGGAVPRRRQAAHRAAPDGKVRTDPGRKVTEPGEDAGITTRLAKGMRAFAISVDVSSGVSGFLRPDDKVDVYWTGSVDGRDGELTRLIETGVKIIAVDQQANERQHRPAPSSPAP